MEITEHLVRAQAKHLQEVAKKALESRRDVTPSIVLVCRQRPIKPFEAFDAEHCCVPVFSPFGLADACVREQAINQARAIALAGDAFAVVGCMATWMVVKTGTPAELQADEALAMPSTHPERRDALVTWIEWSDGRYEAEVLQLTLDQGFVDFDRVEANVIDVDRDNNRILRDPAWGPVPPDIVESARTVAACSIVTVGEALRRLAALRGKEVARG